MIEII